MELDELSRRVETVSQRYAAAHGFERTETWFLLKLQEEVGELTQAFLRRTGHHERDHEGKLPYISSSASRSSS